MTEPILFYFDFSSPYGFLAAREIDDLAARHGREVIWKPMLLGAVFKRNGIQPLVNVPLKGSYTKRDLDREARRLGIDFRLPHPFPFASIAAARAGCVSTASGRWRRSRARSGRRARSPSGA